MVAGSFSQGIGGIGLRFSGFWGFLFPKLRHPNQGPSTGSFGFKVQEREEPGSQQPLLRVSFAGSYRHSWVAYIVPIVRGFSGLCRLGPEGRRDTPFCCKRLCETKVSCSVPFMVRNLVSA